jgi:hypothetical protein
MNKVICGAVLLTAAGFCSDLPVTEVVLYKNGIGYFVRKGELKPGERAGLEFKAADMNDVLKSLTIADAGGGKVTGLHYDSSEPVERKLADFPFRLGDRQPLSALLDGLKGARVELKTGPDTTVGLVMGAREVAGNDKTARREELTLLVDSGELRTLDLAGVTALRFTDPLIQAQLKQYLAAVAAGRSREKRSLWIDSTEEKTWHVAASYVIPTPVWKSSYRLVFADAEGPTLEGWAIVDNTTGDDWSKVSLALVSGRPVSFVSRLFEPHYVGRAERDVLDAEAAAPELHAGAVGGVIGGVVAGERLEANAPPPPPAAAPQAMLKAADARFRQFSDRIAMNSAVAQAAEGTERGELFEYRFGTPVTVRSGESAMLPFLQQKIAARKLLIYTNEASENPRNAAEITNSTGKTLDGGPITVFDGNAYAGEALVETIKGGDKRLISYAVDLGTRITTLLDSSSDVVREVHARRGLLTVRSALRETKTYTVRNVDQKTKTLLIEHPIRPEYRLLNTKASETTSSAYRFEMKLNPDATGKLPVSEERLYDQAVVLVSATPDVLLTYVQNKNLDAAARQQLERIARQKTSIADADGEAKRAEEQTNELFRDQERLRQNINSLNHVTSQQEQVQNYARQLASQETQLASLRDRQSELRKKKAALATELNRLIETANF